MNYHGYPPTYNQCICGVKWWSRKCHNATTEKEYDIAHRRLDKYTFFLCTKYGMNPDDVEKIVESCITGA